MLSLVQLNGGPLKPQVEASFQPWWTAPRLSQLKGKQQLQLGNLVDSSHYAAIKMHLLSTNATITRGTVRPGQAALLSRWLTYAQEAISAERCLLLLMYKPQCRKTSNAAERLPVSKLLLLVLAALLARQSRRWWS